MRDTDILEYVYKVEMQLGYVKAIPCEKLEKKAYNQFSFWYVT